MTKKKPKVETVATPALPVITSIKGFDSDLSCRGFKFEVGKTYEVGGNIAACSNGFHACPEDEHPFSVFEFYGPQSRFAIVEQSGETDRIATKLASASITIKAEIALPDLIQHAVKWVLDRAKPEGPVATGENGLATASGDQGAATASGAQGAATASGAQGAATASGTRGAATASGTRGAATASGDQGAAIATAPGGRVRGNIAGIDLFAREFEWTGGGWRRLSIACGTTGENGIEPGRWYVCKGGKLVEWEA